MIATWLALTALAGPDGYMPDRHFDVRHMHLDLTVVPENGEVFGTVVTIEQEVALVDSGGDSIWQMAPPDLGYGGGHNNDSVAVEVCSGGATLASTTP